MITEPLELFSSIHELEEFDYTVLEDLEAIKEELCNYILLCDNYIHFSSLDEYLSNKDSLYKQNYWEDFWLSFLYTAEYLKYSNVSIQAIDLAYSSKIDCISSPEKIRWIVLDKNKTSSNYILKNSHKKRLCNGEPSKWKIFFERNSQKSYLTRLLQFSDGTIPFFLYKLTYFVLFNCKCEIGVSGKIIKLDKYESFYNNLLKNIDNYITDTTEKLLIKYKAEKIFHPWLIYSYSALLKTQYKQSYYPHIEWNQVLSLYHLSMPCQICDFMINLLCQCLVMDYTTRNRTPTEQINSFKENFNYNMDYFKKFSQYNLIFKRAQFFDLYKRLGSLDNVIEESIKQLDTYQKEAYTCHTIEEIKEKSLSRIEGLYSKISGYAQKTFLDDIRANEPVKDKELRVSTRVIRDCPFLFK